LNRRSSPPLFGIAAVSISSQLLIKKSWFIWGLVAMTFDAVAHPTNSAPDEP
jgi:hypothetical protein